MVAAGWRLPPLDNEDYPGRHVMPTLHTRAIHLTLITLLGVMCAFGQNRDFGKRRPIEDQDRGREPVTDAGRHGSTPTAQPNPSPQPTPPPGPPTYIPLPDNPLPPPDVIIGEPPGSDEFVAPAEPLRLQFELLDYYTFPLDAAFDFSEEEVCAGDDGGADIIFERRGEEALLDVPGGAEIADVGAAGSDAGSDEFPNAGWSETGSVGAVPGHAYMILTSDGEMFRIVVDDLSQHEVLCSWFPIEEASLDQPSGSTSGTGGEEPFFTR